MMYKNPNNYIILQDQSGPVLNFARELEKLPVSNFPILALNLNAEGHVLAAFMSRILGMHHLQTRIQRLKVVLCSWSEVIIHVAYIVTHILLV